MTEYNTPTTRDGIVADEGTIEPEDIEKLIDEVLSLARTESVAGDRRVCAVMDADGQIIWRGSLERWARPAYNSSKITVSLCAKDPFVARDELERELARYR